MTISRRTLLFMLCACVVLAHASTEQEDARELAEFREDGRQLALLIETGEFGWWQSLKDAAAKGVEMVADAVGPSAEERSQARSDIAKVFGYGLPKAVDIFTKLCGFLATIPDTIRIPVMVAAKEYFVGLFQKITKLKQITKVIGAAGDAADAASAVSGSLVEYDADMYKTNNGAEEEFLGSPADASGIYAPEEYNLHAWESIDHDEVERAYMKYLGPAMERLSHGKHGKFDYAKLMRHSSVSDFVGKISGMISSVKSALSSINVAKIVDLISRFMNVVSSVPFFREADWQWLADKGNYPTEPTPTPTPKPDATEAPLPTESTPVPSGTPDSTPDPTGSTPEPSPTDSTPGPSPTDSTPEPSPTESTPPPTSTPEPTEGTRRR